MSNFYKKYQILIDDFVNNNLDYIENYCRNNKLVYIYNNIYHYINIVCFLKIYKII